MKLHNFVARLIVTSILFSPALLLTELESKWYVKFMALGYIFCFVYASTGFFMKKKRKKQQ